MEQHIPNEQPEAPAGEPVMPTAPALSSSVSQPHADPVPASEPVKHKLNHSYIWLGALRMLPVIIVVAFASSTDLIVELALETASSGLGFIALIALLAIILVVTGIVMLVRYISYRYIWYEYAGDEFSYYSGIISKKRVHVPYQRIQSINQKASLFQRIAGVCTVSIETAGGAENKAVVLPYVEKSAAEALRRELFERKQLAQMRAAGIAVPEGAPASSAEAPTGAPVVGIPAPVNPSVQTTPMTDGNALDAPARFANGFRGVFGGDAIDMGTVTYEYGLSNKQLALAAITGKSSFFMVFFSIVMAAASLISSVAFMFGTSEDAIFDTLSSLISLIPTSWIVGAIASVVGFVLVIMVVVWALMVVSTCISYGGFRTRRRGARIETEFGIISHNFNGIDIDRIQSIEISQSFFQRILKSCTLSLARVASAAQDSSQESKATKAQLVIHPFVKLDQVDALLENLLPEWKDLPQADEPLPRRALRRAITRRAILQGGGVWLAILTCSTMFFIGLPIQLDVLSHAELTDYLTFYLVADVISRVLYVIALLLLILDIVGAVLWQRGSGFGYSRAYVTITNSGFSTNRTITPRAKIQLATLQTNPLQRNKKLTTIIALTAAGVGSSALKLIDVEQDAAKRWFAWCHPGGNQTVAEHETAMQ